MRSKDAKRAGNAKGVMDNIVTFQDSADVESTNRSTTSFSFQFIALGTYTEHPTFHFGSEKERGLDNPR